jgi:UrcA family protein
MSRSFLAALAALSVSGLAGQAFAVTPAAAPQWVVKAQVDFRDEASVEALYSKLRRAAASACDSYSANSRVTQADVACAHKVLDDTVRRVDRPLLTAMHDNSYRRSVQLAARASR